ncbi:MAG TPA: sensor histidine kinase [Mariniphaga anaerophila]|uniref:histidine kinase n=1 Tax=Mariniphaga anaerophila TaxID=1484053 RepID=A0A831LYQ6_9BACT|nr:sensor histidine kinase [Mariniphaga anaerophila]
MTAVGNSEIVFIYFAGTSAMIVLAGAVLFFFVSYQKRILKKELEINRIKAEQQKEILKNIFLAQEKERKRIAQDLHDEVGAMLSVVKLNVARFEKKSENKEIQSLAAETKNYLNDVIGQVRRISRALMPPSLEKLGLYYAIEELAGRVNDTGQMQVEFRKTGEPYRFDIKKELAIFRIVQELVNNSIKHAKASHIKLTIRFGSNGLGLAFADNGVGFDLEKIVNTGLGIRNLESRSQIIGAHFKMKSTPGKGTSAILFLTALT